MRLLRSTNDLLVFQLGRREKDLFLSLLQLYPCVPSAHQPLSRSAPLAAQEEDQRLLDEALAEQRAENKRLLQALLSDPKRFKETETSCRLSLLRTDAEWLLQILNDIRVGSWLLLGSPDQKFEALTETTAPHFWAMEMAGHFQMEFLAALTPSP